MSASRGTIFTIGLGLLAACEPGAAPPRLASARAPITGGVVTTGDPAVFVLDVRSNAGNQTLCTATLIAPRTLVTAAHCVDPAMVGGASLTVVASNAPTTADVQPGVNTFEVLELRRHPAWNPAASLDADLALLHLAAAPPVTPQPWSLADLSPLGGAPLRAVGYGASGPDAGLGTKRTVDLSIRQLSGELILLGDLLERGICHGDSGGPALHTFGDGVERLVGVHSFTRGDSCFDGASTRLDAHAAFLREWLAEHEDTCAADLVCSPAPCPAPDPDCQPLGAACASALDCAARRCSGDPQHPAPYCTRACASPADCPAGFTCDGAAARCQRVQLPAVPEGEACEAGVRFCDGLCVRAADGVERCRRPCAQAADCRERQRCEGPDAGARVCVDPPPLEVPLAHFEGPAAGCAQTAGLALPLVLVGLLRRKKRGVRAAGRSGNC